MSPSPDFDLDADAYRRRVVVRRAEPGVVVAEMEDDFHDFVVTLQHDESKVIAADATSKRWPWSTCPGAAEPLRKLAGMPLSVRFTAAGTWTDPKLNCTHQFDTACYAITHAAAGRELRVYDVEIPLREPERGDSRTRVWVDGELRFDWQLTWDGIVDPQRPFDTAPWRGGFMRWADETLSPDDAEAAITLRRAADIGMGRSMDLDAIPIATQLPPVMGGICHTMQPGVVEHAHRHVGSIRDFASHPERLISD